MLFAYFSSYNNEIPPFLELKFHALPEPICFNNDLGFSFTKIPTLSILEFEKLDKVLSAKNVNYEDYAKEISKLFIIDFYTLSNKLSKNDIGGTQFIKEDMRDNFIDQARSTFYKYVEVKSDKRTQKLPEVSLIDDVKVENTTFVIKDTKTTTTTTTKRRSYKKTATTTVSGTTVDAYKVTISWAYKEDLGYEKEAKMIIIKDDNNKLYIVEMD